MHKIFILGPQGSGKGTQAVRLSQKLGVPALSMGQICRNEIASDSELGKKISKIIYEDGELIPDDVALDLLKRRLQKEDAQKGYILDGYPRNQEQYEAYASFDEPTAVLLIDIPHDESMKRLLRRAEIEGRADDKPEQIARRLEIYEEQTKPIVDIYREKGILKEIDGLGEMEDVEQKIDEALKI